jgi:hypothetical protein
MNKNEKQVESNQQKIDEGTPIQLKILLVVIAVSLLGLLLKAAGLI